MDKRRYKIAKWLHQRSRTSRALWSALVTALTFYFGRLLSVHIASTIKLDQQYETAFHAALFVVLLVIIVFIYRVLVDALDVYQQTMDSERATILHAYNLCDQITAEKSSELENTGSAEEALSIVACSTTLRGVQRVVQAAYQTFEAAYGKASASEDRIDFEVTFMTQSLIDNKITIPAAANKDGRMPRSMELRKTNANIYDSTVTADLYRVQSPRIRIVPNTEDSHDYKELYPNQKARIKSSVVFPILSNKNRLLGTLVVHCDRTHFFDLSKEKYWSDLLEIFAKRLALEVQIVRSTHDFYRSGGQFPAIKVETPY